MLCDYCHQKEAIIHIQEIRPDGNKTINLCPACAIQKLAKLHPGLDQLEHLVSNILGMVEGKDAKVRLEQIFNQENGEEAMDLNLECPTCHQKMAQFIKTRRLTCQDCAKTFAAQIQAVIEKELNVDLPPLDAADSAQPSPRKASAVSPKQKQHDALARLKRQLAFAIKQEDYERAAQLRDLIAEFTPTNDADQEQ